MATQRNYYFGDLKAEMAGMLTDKEISQVISNVMGGDEYQNGVKVHGASRPLSQSEMDEAVASIKSGNDNVVIFDKNLVEALGMHEPAPHARRLPGLDFV